MDAGQSWRFLLVDDDEDDFVMAQPMFRDAFREPFVLEWSNNFEDALERICNTGFDVVFVNYVLGFPNGMALVKEVRKRCPGPVIIMVTSWPFDQNFIDEAMSHGVYTVLSKQDVNPENLRTLVIEALDQNMKGR